MFSSGPMMVAGCTSQDQGSAGPSGVVVRTDGMEVGIGTDLFGYG
jgi:hypothetical protein